MNVSSKMTELEGSYKIRGLARRLVLWGLLPFCAISPFVIVNTLFSEATLSPGEFAGVLLINAIAYAFWLSVRRVTQIQISKDMIQFEPIGICIPVNEIQEISLTHQHGGAVKVNLKVLEGDTRLYLGALIWAGTDVTFWVKVNPNV